jgi:hypothetical protein
VEGLSLSNTQLRCCVTDLWLDLRLRPFHNSVHSGHLPVAPHPPI